MNTSDIIKGVCLDQGIGDGYNNPSFGYGGYCLPKDTKQLLSNYENIPNTLIEAIVKSNDVRKRFISETIEKRAETKRSIIGIYRLIMKSNSDNFRESSVFDIMKKVQNDGYKIIVYEPTIKNKEYNGWTIINDFNKFTHISKIIVANRMSPELESFKDKVFCRDIFNRD